VNGKPRSRILIVATKCALGIDYRYLKIVLVAAVRNCMGGEICNVSHVKRPA